MDLLPLDLTGFNPLQLVELKLLRFKVSTYEHRVTPLQMTSLKSYEIVHT